MNIKEAKEQIMHTVQSYLAQDEYGRYEIPVNKQRPVFLMGPPGIGKTEIMSQVAGELGIGLLSYSMTHHTRQSALGLPIIKQKNYFGKEYDVSEYTMSEIISSVYEMMKRTGMKNGLLFLDEINCVSETLSPIMLQFLQYKVFGGHKVPEGWIVVTAGNPPEYNNSVHEFDIVTWDRLKRIDIEPDYAVWKEYAYMAGVHPAIMTYLENKQQHFYVIETTADGKSFVTARGWDDLSRIIRQYEKQGIKVDINVIAQYLQNEKIARDFSIYYDLYKKYQSDYQVDKILNGTSAPEILERAQKAAYDERFSLIGLLLEYVGRDAKIIIQTEDTLAALMKQLSEVKQKSRAQSVDGLIEIEIDNVRSQQKRLAAANALSQQDSDRFVMQRKFLESYLKEARLHPEDMFEAVRTKFNADAERHERNCAAAKIHYDNMFSFCDDAFGKDSQQLLILVTELVANPFIAKYIATKGCPAYFAHDEQMLFHKRNLDIIKGFEKLNIHLK
ncbi:MAG: AAA family ATPase [Oscillospiraceae bacterium]|nr:AAA family ATPase [Oscillospiraceae bacterium]